MNLLSLFSDPNLAPQKWRTPVIIRGQGKKIHITHLYNGYGYNPLPLNLRVLILTTLSQKCYLGVKETKQKRNDGISLKEHAGNDQKCEMTYITACVNSASIRSSPEGILRKGGGKKEGGQWPPPARRKLEQDRGELKELKKNKSWVKETSARVNLSFAVS